MPLKVWKIMSAISTNKPKIYAHRGFSSQFPENTMLAFKEAAKLGIDGIELDVQLTKDQVAVICHDEEINRTSNGEGYIKDKNLSELKEYSFHAGHSEYSNQEDVKLPTLEEFLDWVKDTDLEVNLELKTNIFSYEGLVEQVLELVDRYALQDRVFISSFNHYTIRKVKEAKPDMTCAFLSAHNLLNPGEYCKKYGVDLYHPLYIGLSPEDFEDCAQKDVSINAWTIDEAGEMERLAEMGLNGIITNKPDLVLEVFYK